MSLPLLRDPNLSLTKFRLMLKKCSDLLMVSDGDRFLLIDMSETH